MKPVNVVGPAVVALISARRHQGIGRKAELLRRLADMGFPVPDGVVVTWGAQALAATDPVAARDLLMSELQAFVVPGRGYAIRSSADVEDAASFSYAGQFTTMLDVHGLEGVVAAVEEVWASAGADAAAYHAEAGAVEAPRLAVIVQEMVPACFAGVVFSRNPLTGLDETIVEAVAGSGEALVQGGVTPERWVDKWGAWREQPERPLLTEELAGQIVAGCRQIARALGEPVDLEWVHDGDRLLWVQLRPITALAGLAVYSNRIAREVLPGQIKPLVWSINVPLVNRAWIRLFTQLIGPNDLDPDSLSRAFHYRAYFNMTQIGDIFAALGMPRELLELLMGIDAEGDLRPTFRPTPQTWRHMPRLLRFVGASLRLQSRFPQELDRLRAVFAAVAAADLEGVTEAELLARVDRLGPAVEDAAYYNIVVPLQMQALARALATLAGPAGARPEAFFTPADAAALAELDPGRALEALHARFVALPAAQREALRARGAEALTELASEHPLRQELDDFRRRFGHLSASGNDFSAVPWRENPELVLQMVTGWVESDAARRAASTTVRGTLRHGPRRWLVSRLAVRAGRFRLFREQISSQYTLGYGLHRDLFLALGDRLVARGVLRTREDVYYLYLDELRGIVTADSATSATEAARLVASRREEMESTRDTPLPDIIFGEAVPPPARAGWSLRGVPTSRGYYEGPARVVTGPEAFGDVETGDVLVIPFADVSWTPLLLRAGAIISESGGLLSHSSIVAREHSIPAVVSVTGACRRLANGSIVAVDGTSGRIAIVGDGSELGDEAGEQG